VNKAKSPLQTLLASQPIYTRNKDLFGFELFFRHEANLTVKDVGGDLATNEVLLNLATGVTEQVDFYSRPMFINLPESLLYSDSFLPQLSPKVVIELPATTSPSQPTLDTINKWRSLGYHFALDNFNFDPSYKPLLELIEYTKVDSLNESPRVVEERMAEFASYPLTWIAKRLETEEQYLQYVELGFLLFQGYFLAHPLPVRGYALRGKINNSAGTINAVSNPEIEIDELAEVVSRDPNLATQILKIINSPVCALGRTVESLRDAIVYLGLGQVRKWAIMMSLMNNAETSSGTIRLVLTRAKACENYAAAEGYSNPDKAFLVGLLSGIKLLFGIETKVFMEQVALHADIEGAVLAHRGFLGEILDEVLKAEHSIMQIRAAAMSYDMTILGSYLEANQWVETILAVTGAS